MGTVKEIDHEDTRPRDDAGRLRLRYGNEIEPEADPDIPSEPFEPPRRLEPSEIESLRKNLKEASRKMTGRFVHLKKKGGV